LKQQGSVLPFREDPAFFLVVPAFSRRALADDYWFEKIRVNDYIFLLTDSKFW